jgi:hypothetical protein
MAQIKVTFTMSSSFYAAGAKLPAGTYTLRQMQDGRTTRMLPLWRIVRVRIRSFWEGASRRRRQLETR